MVLRERLSGELSFTSQASISASSPLPQEWAAKSPPRAARPALGSAHTASDRHAAAPPTAAVLEEEEAA